MVSENNQSKMVLNDILMATNGYRNFEYPVHALILEETPHGTNSALLH